MKRLFAVCLGVCFAMAAMGAPTSKGREPKQQNLFQSVRQASQREAARRSADNSYQSAKTPPHHRKQNGSAPSQQMWPNIPPIDRAGANQKLKEVWDKRLEHMLSSYANYHGFYDAVIPVDEVPGAIPRPKEKFMWPSMDNDGNTFLVEDERVAAFTTPQEHLSYLHRTKGWPCMICELEGVSTNTAVGKTAKHPLNNIYLTDWDWFLYQNKIVTQGESLVYKKQAAKRNQWATQVRALRPNYEEMTKDKKFIFIWDGVDHGDAEQVKEHVVFLNAVRKANPDKRILLASEFTNYLPPSFRISTKEILEDGRRTYNLEMPYPGLLFANAKLPENFWVYPSHKPVETTAGRLQMDLLALDDHVIFGGVGNWVKIGDELIGFPTSGFAAKEVPEEEQNAEEAAAYAAENRKRATADAFFKKIDPDYYKAFETDAGEYYVKVSDILSRSNFGAELRNRQWADYINAVSEFYDIVVVAAGSGHQGIKEKLKYDEASSFEFQLLKVKKNEKLREEYEKLEKKCNGVCGMEEGEGEEGWKLYSQTRDCDVKDACKTEQQPYSKIYGEGETPSAEMARGVDVWLPE